MRCLCPCSGSERAFNTAMGVDVIVVLFLLLYDAFVSNVPLNIHYFHECFIPYLKKKVFLIELVVAVVFLKRVYYHQLMVGLLLKFHKGTDPRDS